MSSFKPILYLILVVWTFIIVWRIIVAPVPFSRDEVFYLFFYFLGWAGYFSYDFIKDIDRFQKRVEGEEADS